MQEHETFKGFNDSQSLLDRYQCFNIMDGKKNISYVTLGLVEIT